MVLYDRWDRSRASFAETEGICPQEWAVSGASSFVTKQGFRNKVDLVCKNLFLQSKCPEMQIVI